MPTAGKIDSINRKILLKAAIREHGQRLADAASSRSLIINARSLNMTLVLSTEPYAVAREDPLEISIRRLT
jgi:hypothetical protein